MSVIVRVKVTKKSQNRHWNKKAEDTEYPTNHTIDMQVVYTSDPNHPNYNFSTQSGGTAFQLCTINEEAAKQFELEGEYDVVFNKVQ